MCNPPTKVTTPTNTTGCTNAQSKYKRRPPFYFRTGKLEWGYHGILGVGCLVMTAVSLYTLDPKHILFLQILIHFQCRDAYKMISLSPMFTPICDVQWPWGGVTKIAAEHQPAFRLTIDVLHYVTVRVVGQCVFGSELLMTNTEYYSLVFWGLYAFQLWRCWRLNPLHVYPFKKFLTHFQPWLLLVPMGMGVFLDTISTLIQQEDKLTMTELLQIQALCLTIAFLFTMAFRKYVSMVFMFFVSVAIIWSLNMYVWKQLNDTLLELFRMYKSRYDEASTSMEDMAIQQSLHDNMSKGMEALTTTAFDQGAASEIVQQAAESLHASSEL